jgi:hypothetical protein
MNRALKTMLPFLVAAHAVAQSPAAPPPSLTASVTESSHVTRFVAGPGDRPQGLILRNGTFVALSPSLAQRLPVSLHKGTSLQVTGEALTYDGSRTVQARSITIAGVAYADDPAGVGGGTPMGPATTAPPPPPPPPPGRAGAPPPPPPPCGVAAPPPPADGTAPAPPAPAVLPQDPPGV